MHSLFQKVLIGNVHLFKPLKRNSVLIVITPLICVVTMAFKVFYKSILHCLVHKVTTSILYIVLPFGNIMRSSFGKAKQSKAKQSKANAINLLVVQNFIQILFTDTWKRQTSGRHFVSNRTQLPHNYPTGPSN